MKHNTTTRDRRGFISSGGLMGIAILFVIVLILFFTAFSFKTIAGNEVGVKETWGGGVEPNSLPPKTYWINNWTEDIYVYPTSGRVFVMNDKSDRDENFAEGRRSDALQVNSKDNQKVNFHIILTWRIDPAYVINLHKSYRDNIEERLIRPEIVRAVGTRATVEDAIALYSGERLNNLRKQVEDELRAENGRMRQSGIIVDSFVIEKPEFPNKDYIDAIEKRQLAIITETRAKEQEKANIALAAAAKAEALTQQNKELVAAETDRQRQVLQQRAISEREIIAADAAAKNVITRETAEAEKITIAAKAEAARNIAISEAQKQAELNRAVGIEAVGRAEAEAKKLTFIAYAGQGGDNYTRIQVAEAYAKANNTIRFFPSNATYNTIASDFNKGLNLLVGQPEAPVK